MLEHAADRYGGVVVDEASFPPATDAFVAALASSIEAWRAAGVRGVWLKIPTERAELVGPAVHDHGFGFHHAEPTYVMLTRWLPGDAEENHLPPNASHQVGVGAFVTRGDGKVLLVRNAAAPRRRRPGRTSGSSPLASWSRARTSPPTPRLGGA